MGNYHLFETPFESCLDPIRWTRWFPDAQSVLMFMPGLAESCWGLGFRDIIPLSWRIKWKRKWKMKWRNQFPFHFPFSFPFASPLLGVISLYTPLKGPRVSISFSIFFLADRCKFQCFRLQIFCCSTWNPCTFEVYCSGYFCRVVNSCCLNRPLNATTVNTHPLSSNPARQPP